MASDDIPIRVLRAIRKEAGYIWEGEELEIEVAKEVEAYRALQHIQFDDVPAKVIAAFKKEAAMNCYGGFSIQLDAVESDVRSYRQTQEVLQTMERTKSLVIAMEQLIGKRCYSDSIRNYGRGGVLESEGRSFRYPITTISDDERASKRKTVPATIAAKELISGYYKVGNNELSIIRSLIDIVRLIEREYGVDLSDRNRKKPG